MVDWIRISCLKQRHWSLIWTHQLIGLKRWKRHHRMLRMNYVVKADRNQQKTTCINNVQCEKSDASDVSKTIHSQSLTWNLKMAPWNRRFLLGTIIFRFHVKLWECIHSCLVVKRWNSSAQMLGISETDESLSPTKISASKGSMWKNSSTLKHRLVGWLVDCQGGTLTMFLYHF